MPACVTAQGGEAAGGDEDGDDDGDEAGDVGGDEPEEVSRSSRQDHLEILKCQLMTLYCLLVQPPVCLLVADRLWPPQRTLRRHRCAALTAVPALSRVPPAICRCLEVRCCCCCSLRRRRRKRSPAHATCPATPRPWTMMRRSVGGPGGLPHPHPVACRLCVTIAALRPLTPTSAADAEPVKFSAFIVAGTRFGGRTSGSKTFTDQPSPKVCFFRRCVSLIAGLRGGGGGAGG